MSMKNITSIFCIALTAILTHTTSYGNIIGSDDFNDNSKDLAKWGTDIVGGSGTLTETSHVLQYTASGSSDPESSLRSWIANNLSFTSDWTLQLDVNVPNLTLTRGQRYEFGLQVSNGDHSTDFFTTGLRLNNASGTPIREFHSSFKVNGADQVIGGVNSTTTSTSAAVRIRYDAASNTLFAEFDANGAVGGYNFTTFDSRNIAGWNMTAISVFNAGAGGISKGNVVISFTDNVSGDNFLAVPVVPEPSSLPRLNIVLTSSNILRLEWPSLATNFILEASSALPSLTAWTTVTNIPVLDGINLVVTNLTSESSRFYRLKGSP